MSVLPRFSSHSLVNCSASTISFQVCPKNICLSGVMKGQLIQDFRHFCSFWGFSLSIKNQAVKALLGILFSICQAIWFHFLFCFHPFFRKAAHGKTKFKWFSGPTISISEYVHQVAAFDSLQLWGNPFLLNEMFITSFLYRNTCQAWGVSGELRAERLKLPKIKLFYARLILSSTLLWFRASVKSGGGAAPSLCDVPAPWAGFNWAGLSRLGSGHWRFSQFLAGRAWKGREREIRKFAAHRSCNLPRDRDSYRGVLEFGCRHWI